MTSILHKSTIAVALLLGASAANAYLTNTVGTFTTVIGTRAVESTSLPTTGDDAGAARASWLTEVSLIGTETFTNMSTADPVDGGPLTVDGGLLTCFRPGDPPSRACRVQNSIVGGRFDTSGGTSGYMQNLVGTGIVGDIVINFTAALNAFSFYMTDANDFGSETSGGTSSKTLVLTDTDGNERIETISATSTASAANSNLIFFGFYDSGATKYTSVRFVNSNSNDGYGIDDLTRASFRTTPPTGTPEPATLLLLGAALAGIGASRLRARR